MKQILEVRTNPIYSADSKELTPKIEVIIIHTDGKQYIAKGEKVQSIPILKETRFTVEPETLDKFVADLQGVRLQMNQIMDNCKVINHVITSLNKSES